jgi:periplasmic divalent cation tolerance protein
MLGQALVILVTFPDAETARRIVTTLVEERLAACGNLVPGVESIYRWQGAVETASEVLVLLKTENSRYEALESRLKELHPYEVPECLALTVAEGSLPYLRWLNESVN